MKVLFYGAGAVGLGINSFLIKADLRPTIVARPSTIKALKNYGIKRTGVFGDFLTTTDSFDAFNHLDKVTTKNYDYILVTVKSFDSRKAARQIAQQKKLFNRKTKIILFQNGWGNAEIFCQYFPQHQIFNARVITGFTRPKPNEVRVTVHADRIHLGSLFHENITSLNPLCRVINKGGLPCAVVKDIEKDLWEKLIYNCALNPLGAVLGLSYGALAENKKTRIVMEKIIKEIYQVMKAANFRTHHPTAEDYMKIFYKKLLPATAHHRSSTLQALKSGKKVEIDALTGVVIKLAKQHQIPVPENLKIYQRIKKIEQQNKN